MGGGSDDNGDGCYSRAEQCVGTRISIKYEAKRVGGTSDEERMNDSRCCVR
jgi:hypothetical protein